MMKALSTALAVLLAVLTSGTCHAAATLKDGDIIFHTSRSAQSLAVQRATGSRYSHMGVVLLQGGKTTVLKAMCEVLEAQGYVVVQTALAGKAVKRMQESTGRPAWTLATLIRDYAHGDDSSAGRDKPIAVLIDEASMVDLISFPALARKLHRTVKIVLIGDPHQLPPIGPGLVLHCLTSGNVPHVELKVGKRFGSEIAHAANLIRDGLLPQVSDHGAVRLLEVADHDMAAAASELYLRSPLDTVVLSTTRQAAQTVNQFIQAATSSGRREVLVWNDQYECMQAEGLKEGDLVICVRNHWDLGLQNGSMGRLLKTWDGDDGDTLGEIEWDDGVVRKFDRNLLDSLDWGMHSPCTKAKGPNGNAWWCASHPKAA